MRVDTGRLRVVSPAGSSTSLEGDALGGSDGGLDHTGGPTSPGVYIREQRERQGLSLEQLAVATKIPRPQLAALEDDRFGELNGPVFVKGFLRCCARCLKLDEQTVIDLLYEQERERLHGRRRDNTGTVSGPVHSIVAAESSGLWPRFVSHATDPRLILWFIVAILVALLVIIAFTIASSQGGAMQS